MKLAVSLAAVLSLLFPSAAAHAQEAYKPPPAPYSIPWQLRPLGVANVLRSDTSFAFYDPGAQASGGATVSSMLLASTKLTPRFAPLLRFAFVYNDAPALPDDSPPSGAALVNPLVGAVYARALTPALRWSAFAGAALPLGQGGGMSPDPGAAEAAARGIPARSAMDNAMFATNYFTVIGGLGAGWVSRGFTAQAEITVLQLFRVRGPEAQDERRTNFTAGVHGGAFVTPWLSLGGELRYQRWLSDAAPVRANDAARETVTIAAGPRLHIRLAGKRWLRPGISYSRVLDAPFSTSDYQMVQVDVPFVF